MTATKIKGLADVKPEDDRDMWQRIRARVDDKLGGVGEEIKDVEANKAFDYETKDGKKVVRGRDGNLYKEEALEDKAYDGKALWTKIKQKLIL